jgi:predicted nucleotide-binding protein
MYNLIVWGALDEHWSEDVLEIERARFLEYTSDDIKTQLNPLSNEAITSIKSWPSLVMEEGRGEECAYIAQIQDIQVKNSNLILKIFRVWTEPKITNDNLWRIRDRLDIEQFEFSRSHWAVKERNLLEVLNEAGISLAPEMESRFRNLPLPSPERTVKFKARDAMSLWDHTKIDDFLLEAGVSGLRIGREIGSRRDRVNAILKFVLDNPSAKIADNSMLSAFFVRAALGTEANGDASENASELEDEHSERHDEALARKAKTRSPNRVFIVHGRDNKAQNKVASFLRRVELEPVVLHEQPSMGRHLLTKFIDEAELVTFAVIVMTADDVGGLSSSELAPRARQNVILELGYFLAHLGQSRVCALVAPGLETPSDFDGIVYIKMDENSRWEYELERELRAAGMPLHDG